MFNFLLDLIFPQFCVGCQRLGGLLCDDCYQKINFYAVPLKLQLSNPVLDQVSVMAEYEGITKKLITSLKYLSVRRIGCLLAKIIYHTMELPQIEAVTAVPLHPKRKRQRGFNQAVEIGDHVAHLIHTPYLHLLQRLKHSSPQAQIKDQAQRLTRLKNTFAPRDCSITPPSSVLLVDDVVTTGATLNECAQILKQIGVNKVFGLIIAHGN